MVADDLAEHTLAPFHRGPAEHRVTGRVVLPDGHLGDRPGGGDPGQDQRRGGVRPEPLVWVGLFAYPEPTGVPGAGLLRHGAGTFTLPVLPGHPWLLATVVEANADPVEQLVPRAAWVAFHPAPILGPLQVTLTFRPAWEWEAPILTALPALRKIGVSGRGRHFLA